MIHDILAGALAVNKIVDQDAAIHRGQVNYSNLSNKYNQLVDRYNALVDQHQEACDSMRNLANENEELQERLSLRVRELEAAFTYKTTKVSELEERIADKDEWIERAIETYQNLEQEQRKTESFYTLFQIILSNIFSYLSEEDRMRALASVLPHYSPEVLKKGNWGVDHHELSKLIKYTVFSGVGCRFDPEKYEQWKKELEGADTE